VHLDIVLSLIIYFSSAMFVSRFLVRPTVRSALTGGPCSGLPGRHWLSAVVSSRIFLLR